MASYDIAAVRSALNTLLGTVASVQNVYDYPSPKVDGYPAVIFELSNEDGQFLDDALNQRVLTFTLWVACEIPTEGIAAASALLDGVTKDVVNILEKSTNQTLSGSCDWMMPVIGKREQVASPEGNFMYQELQLRVYIASSIT